MTKFFQNLKSTLLNFVRRVFGFHLIEKRLFDLSEDARNVKNKVLAEIESSTALQISMREDLTFIGDRLELIFNQNKIHALKINLLNDEIVSVKSFFQFDRDSFSEVNAKLNVIADKNNNYSMAIDALHVASRTIV